MEVYGARCSILDHGPEEVLEAAHIVPHSESGVNELDNGLLLRSDLHHLFDDHMLSIDPTTKIIHVKDSLLNSKEYAGLDKRNLRPRNDGTYPSFEYLSEHWEIFGTDAA